MVRLANLILPVKDVAKAKAFFLDLGFKVLLETKLADHLSPEAIASQLLPRPDEVCVVEDERHTCIEIVRFYKGFQNLYGGRDAFVIKVEDMQKAWATLLDRPGVRPIVAPLAVPKELVEGVEAVQPGQAAFVAVDLGREDGEEQVIELLEGVTPH